MADHTVEEAIIAEIHDLEIAQQKKVLDYTRSLTKNYVKGVQGKNLLRFSSTIDKDDLQKMASAIADCEKKDVPFLKMISGWLLKPANIACHWFHEITIFKK